MISSFLFLNDLITSLCRLTNLLQFIHQQNNRKTINIISIKNRMFGLTPSSAASSVADGDRVVTMAAGCATSTAEAADDASGAPAVVTIMGALASVCAGAGTILICRGGGGAVATTCPAAAAPRGLACRGGGAGECTICCSRGGGGVFCICWRGGGCRGDCSCCLDITILLTVGGAGGGAGGLCAPVRERVVTCGRSKMMLDVQMLVMVLLSGACTGMRDERVGAATGVGSGGGAAAAGGGGDGGASNTSIVGCCGKSKHLTTRSHICLYVM